MFFQHLDGYKVAGLMSWVSEIIILDPFMMDSSSLCALYDRITGSICIIEFVHPVMISSK